MAGRDRYGASHPKLAVSLELLAEVQRGRGALAAAREAIDEAIALIEAQGLRDPRLVSALEQRAAIESDAGQPRAAITDLRRAVTVDDAEPERGSVRLGASVRFALARELAAQGEIEEARALAQEARERYRQEGAEDGIARVEQWLAQHDP